jgi:predicted secreted protein
MANPTTNFGWVMPTSTSLVTNLPADFNTFGQGVDTSMAQLKGGTTGQILSKTSATDMAFTWITNDVGDITAVTTAANSGLSGGATSGAVALTLATAAKGDLIVGTGSGTASVLTAGTNGYSLQTDSSTATGLKWASVAAGGGALTLLSTTTLSGASTTVSISGTYTRLIVEWDSIAVSTGNQVFIELNAVSAQTYAAGTTLLGSTLYSFDSGYPNNLPMNGGQNFYASSTANKGMAVFENASVSTGVKPFVLFSTGLTTASGNPRAYSNANGIVNLAAAISSIKFTCSTGSLTGGTVLIYGVS